jgi:hypothetical protein
VLLVGSAPGLGALAAAGCDIGDAEILSGADAASVGSAELASVSTLGSDVAEELKSTSGANGAFTATGVIGTINLPAAAMKTRPPTIWLMKVKK